jgi:NADPH-dependent glutamate synthase beta subunit-like oxidoreductase
MPDDLHTKVDPNASLKPHDQTNKGRETPYVRGSNELLAHVGTETLNKYNGQLMHDDDTSRAVVRALVADIVRTELRHPARQERDRRNKEEADRLVKQEAEKRQHEADQEAGVVSKPDYFTQPGRLIGNPNLRTPTPPMVPPGPLDRPADYVPPMRRQYDDGSQALDPQDEVP